MHASARIAALTLAAGLALAGCAKPISPPTAVASARVAEVAVGAIVELDASQSTDANSPALPIFYRWAFKALPPGSAAVLNDATVVTPSFTADVQGTYTVLLVVSNGKATSTPAEVTVTAGPCGAIAPTVKEVAATPELPGVDQVVQLTANVIDADLEAPCTLQQAIAYEWSIASLPAGSKAALNQKDAENPSFTPDVPGDYQIRLVVTDSTGRASAPFLYKVTVSGCGAAAPSVGDPSAEPAAPNIGQVVQLTAETGDADNEAPCSADQTLSYRWFFVSLPAGSLATLNDAAISSPSFVADLAGDYVVRVRVTDSTGRSTLSKATSISVAECGGGKPVVQEIAPAPAQPNAGQVVQLQATIADADSQPPCSMPQSFRHAWSIVAQPAGSLATLNNPVAANPSFTADVPGDYIVELVVTDGTGLRSAASRFTVPVSTCRSAVPVATIQAPSTAGIGAGVPLAAQVTDADTAAPCSATETFRYAWAFVSLPAGSRAALNATGISGPTFIPDVAGDYALRLVVTDAAGHASAPANATITVSACGGNAPVATATANPSAPGVNQAVQLTASTTDADNDSPCTGSQTFTYQWSFESLPAGSKAALNSTSAVSPSFVTDLAGEYVVRLVSTDSTGRISEPARVTITASGCGASKPVAVAAATPTAPGVGQAVKLSATVTDSDNDAPCSASQTFTYAWSFESLPAGSAAALNGATAASPSFVPDLAGDYALRLVVTDSTGHASTPAILTVTATGCGAALPTVAATANPAAPGIGQPVQLGATVTDADNDAPCSAGQTFTYAWTFDALPAGSKATLNSATAASPSFLPDVAGAYALRVVATDSTGRRSAPATVTVTATGCGAAAPTVTATANPISPNIGQPVLLNASATDADNAAPCSAGQSFSYGWTFVSLPAGSKAALNSTTAVTPSFVPDLAGDYVLRLVATDSTGKASQPKDVTVTATGCGAALPAAALSANPAAPGLGQAVLLSAAVTDADNAAPCSASQTFTYAWAFASLPAGSRAALNSATAAKPSFVPDVAGDYDLRLVVTDSTGRAGLPASLKVTASGCGGAAPTATLAATPSAPSIGQGVLLTATAADADNAAPCSAGQTFTFQWNLESLPAGSRAALNSATAARPSFVPDLGGDYVVRAVVTDSTGRASAPLTLTVTASGCGGNAPSATFAATPSSAGVGSAIRLTPTVTDADNDATCQGSANPPAIQTFAFSWTLLAAPSGSRAVLSSGTAREPSFTADAAGDYVVRLVVTDSTGRASAPVDRTLTVGTCGSNAPTVLTATATPSNGTIGAAVSLTATFDDADNAAACQAILGSLQAHQVLWRVVSAPAASRAGVARADTLAASFVPDAAGSYVLEVAVTDSTGRSARRQANLSVSTCGTAAPTAAPFLAPTSPTQVGVPVQLVGNGLDADFACGATQTLSYRWWLADVPAGSTATIASPFAANASFVPDRAGNYVAMVVVTDSTGLQGAPAPVSITVGPCGGNAPVARITAPATVVSGTLVQLDALGSTNPSFDSDNDPLACGLSQALGFHWEIFSAPLGSTASLNPSQTTTNPWFRADRAGSYVLRLWVSDSTGRWSEPATATVTAN